MLDVGKDRLGLGFGHHDAVAGGQICLVEIAIALAGLGRHREDLPDDVGNRAVRGWMQACNFDLLAVHAPEPDKRMAVGGRGPGSEVDVIDRFPTGILLHTGFLCGGRRNVAACNGCKRHDPDDNAAMVHSGPHWSFPRPPKLTQIACGQLRPPSRTARLSVGCSPQYLAVTGYFPTGYLPGSFPIGALPTGAGGGGSLRGKSAADATLAKANVATRANTRFFITSSFHASWW